MVNRKIAPQANQIKTLDFLYPEKLTLSNGIEIHGLNAGSQELVKVDLIFEAGTWYQSKNLIAGLTNAFMNQGSKNYTAQEIAEAFDSKGAYLQLSADQQFGNVSFLTLNKHLDAILKIVSDVIRNPIFPEKEIKAQLAKKKQQFIIENNKVKTLAQKKFSTVLLGEKHPYSNSNKFEDYDALTIDDFKDFHSKHYTPNTCKIVLAGKYNSSVINALEKYFGINSWTKDQQVFDFNHTIYSSEKFKHKVIKDDAVQSAIRMGMFMPNRKDTDFHALNVLVTIFGGYFGSRLMMNIREDKGYTYGIGAGIYTWPKASYLSISTEVGTDVTDFALSEIYKEMEILKTDKVSDSELSMVKNYLLGEHLRSFDGVFAMSNSLRTLIEAGVWYDHFDTFVAVVNEISANDLIQLANKYFKIESTYEIVAGK